MVTSIVNRWISFEWSQRCPVKRQHFVCHIPCSHLIFSYSRKKQSDDQERRRKKKKPKEGRGNKLSRRRRREVGVAVTS